ncbi:hypothetical protein HCJ46_16100 [Listeria booriae]|uniref:hypothetical protein n=1 Tax=Listeria booriae TaxID=1552123 RepID=UPI00162A0BFF|nr:hypothetical protein [Listeria booriae]MBC1920282.1 hypothetical protein [Listeria booriae]
MNNIVRAMFDKVQYYNDVVINNISDADLEENLVQEYRQFSDILLHILHTSLEPIIVDEVTAEDKAETQFMLYALRMVSMNIKTYEAYLQDTSKTDLRIYRHVLTKDGFGTNDQWESITIKDMLDDHNLATAFISPIAFCDDSEYVYAEDASKQDAIKELGAKAINVSQMLQIYVDSIVKPVPFLTLHEQIFQKLNLFNDKISFNLSYKSKGEDTLYEDFYTFYNGMYPVLRNTYNYDAIKDQPNPSLYAEGAILFQALLAVKDNVDNYKLFLEGNNKAEMKKIILFANGFHSDGKLSMKFADLKNETESKKAYATGRRFKQPVGFIDADSSEEDFTANDFQDLELTQLARIFEKVERAERED